jgi:agmatinase
MSTERIPLANVTSINEAEIALILVADESKSLALRKGAYLGPKAMISAFEKSETFKREGKTILICPMRGNHQDRKIIPVIIGGDHSVTTIAIDAISAASGEIGLMYFDAHPDFVSSKTDYYGSVITDSLGKLNKESVTLIGTRAAEPEEAENIIRNGFHVMTPLDILERGINGTVEEICDRNTSRKYVSIDLDCLDPAFGPGVSVPTPCGLTSVELTYLVKQAVSTGILGMDIVELCPPYDINDITASFAARLLSECIASIRSGYLR